MSTFARPPVHLFCRQALKAFTLSTLSHPLTIFVRVILFIKYFFSYYIFIFFSPFNHFIIYIYIFFFFYHSTKLCMKKEIRNSKMISHFGITRPFCVHFNSSIVLALSLFLILIARFQNKIKATTL